MSEGKKDLEEKKEKNELLLIEMHDHSEQKPDQEDENRPDEPEGSDQNDPDCHGDDQPQPEDKKADDKKGTVSSFFKKAIRKPGSWCLLITAASLIWLVISLLQFGLIRASLAGLLFGAGLALCALAGYWFFMTERKAWKIPAVLLCACLTLMSFLGHGFLSMVSKGIYQISGPRAPYVQTAGIYTSSIAPASSLEALNGQTLGLMEGRDDRINQAVLDELKSKNIEVHTKEFSSLQSLYKAVRGQAVRACILTPADIKIAQEFAGAGTNGPSMTQIYSVPIATGVTIPSNDQLNLDKDPFTVLISGSEDPLSQADYRSTLNVLAAVNPQSREILFTVIPRSLYVGYSCPDELGCLPEDQKDKAGYASYHSIEALRQTIANLTGATIDFTVRIDLDTLGALVDLDPFAGTDTSLKFDNLNENGQITPMTGPRVKQYLGVLNDFTSADFDQELNQLRLLTSLKNQTGKLLTLSNLQRAMEILDHSVSTTFSYQQLCELIRTYFLFPEKEHVTFTSIDGTYETALSPALTEHAYVLEPDENSLSQVKEAIQTVLSGGTPECEGVIVPESPALTSAAGQSEPAESEKDNA